MVVINKVCVVTSISLTPEEMNTLTEIVRLENIPRKSRSSAVGFLIRYYAEKKAGEFKALPPDKAKAEADRLEKAANWYRLQAAADEEEAKREVANALGKVV